MFSCAFSKKYGGGGTSIPDSRVNKHRKKLHRRPFKTKEVIILFFLSFGNNASGFHLILIFIL